MKKQTKISVKMTRKQKDALECLVVDLDELNNKPRRLFGSLRKFMVAFIEGENTKIESVQRLNIFEEQYYEFIDMPNFGKTILQHKREAVREANKDPLTSRTDYEIKEALDNFAEKLLIDLNEYVV